MIVHQTIGRWFQQLWLTTAVVLRVFGDDLGNLSGVLWPKLALGPKPCVFREALRGPTPRIPGKVPKKLSGKLHRFDVADINNPDACGPVPIRQVHLLPNLGDGCGVQPFVRARATDVIEMVVDTCTTRTFAFCNSRQAANVSPVVVTPK